VIIIVYHSMGCNEIIIQLPDELAKKRNSAENKQSHFYPSPALAVSLAIAKKKHIKNPANLLAPDWVRLRGAQMKTWSIPCTSGLLLAHLPRTLLSLGRALSSSKQSFGLCEEYDNTGFSCHY
jgi:hypothetical protein